MCMLYNRRDCEGERKRSFFRNSMQRGHQDPIGQNQYFSSIINHENTAYCLISGVCALLRFTQNGEEIIYHYFREKDLIGGVPFFLSHKGAAQINTLYSFCSLYTKTECILYKIPFPYWRER